MDPLNELIETLKKFPGLGNKSARRIVLHLLKKDNSELEDIAGKISSLKKNLHTCEQCGNISDKNPCDICKDPLRDRKTLCVIEDIESLWAFEQTGIYNGLYHILGARLSPLDYQEMNDEALEFLSRHIKALKPDEIIIATSPKMEGDLTYYALVEALKKSKVKTISRLSYGLPIGGSIEFADKMTLHTSLTSRQLIK